MGRKSAVIKESLCDWQTEVIPLRPARSQPDSNDESRRVFIACPGRKTVVAIFSFCSLTALLWMLAIGLDWRVFAQDQPSEYQIKAAFLFNFAKFVEWPPDAFKETNSPIVIGVLGENVFGNSLAATIRDKTVNDRHFEFKTFNSPAEATNCHILFVSPRLKESLPNVVAGLHNASVLTVGETDDFIKAGGMVNFLIEDNKIRFQINDDAAKKAGLKISSKLLALATHSH
jgi:hypothetical protein